MCLGNIFPFKVAGWVYVLHKPQYYLFCKLSGQLICAYWQLLQTFRDDRYGWGEAGLGKRLKGGKGKWGRAVWIWKCGCSWKPGVKWSRFLLCAPYACLPSLPPQNSRSLVVQLPQSLTLTTHTCSWFDLSEPLPSQFLPHPAASKSFNLDPHLWALTCFRSTGPQLLLLFIQLLQPFPSPLLQFTGAIGVFVGLFFHLPLSLEEGEAGVAEVGR